MMMMRSIDEQIIDRLFVEQVLNGLIWLCLVHNFFFFPAIVVLNLFVFSSKSVRFLIICCCRAFVGTNDFVFNTTIIKKKTISQFWFGIGKKTHKRNTKYKNKNKKKHGKRNENQEQKEKPKSKWSFMQFCYNVPTHKYILLFSSFQRNYIKQQQPQLECPHIQKWD